MKHLARDHCWWPSINKDIEQITRSCPRCVATADNPPRALGHIWEEAEGPWHRIHVDYAGPINGMWFLIIVDAFSKWLEVYAVKSTTSAITCNRLDECFARYGYPEQLVSDNGSQFCSGEFQRFLSHRGILHHRTAPFHPSTNGQAERFVQTVKKALAKTAGPSHEEQFAEFLLRFRNQPSEATGKRPAELFLGRRLRDRLGMMTEERKENRSASTRPNTKFSVGERVAVRVYTGRQRWSTGKIKRVFGRLHYEVQVGRRTMKRHQDQLRRTDCDIPDEQDRRKQLLLMDDPSQDVTDVENPQPHLQDSPQTLNNAPAGEETQFFSPEATMTLRPEANESRPLTSTPLASGRRRGRGISARFKDYVLY